MSSETKTCQNCRSDFVIESEDFAFYDKIKVPPPTFCPECRMQRRFAWRNEQHLYRRTCGLTGKEVISCFAPDSNTVVYDREEWWTDKWDATEYGREYDFSKPFFEQWRELFSVVPHPAVFNGKTVNSPYSNYIGEFKDAYLVSASWTGENVTYANRTHTCKDCMDMYLSSDCERSYGNVGSVKLYKTFFARDSENCSDSFFLYDCKNCTSCIGCVNLRNRSYCIFNQQYSKEEYQQKLKELKLDTWTGLNAAREKFDALQTRAIHKFANILNSQNCTGDVISNSSNCENCFGMFHEARDSKHTMNAGYNAHELYDCYGIGDSAELFYEMYDSGVQGVRCLFGATVWSSSDTQYSFNCHNCKDCFGCIGLRKKQYCILNKQYSKEEYEELLPKIIEHMNSMPYRGGKDREYRYGEFFPMELSPFGYNHTVGQNYFPLSKETVLAQKYRWQEEEPSKYNATLKAQDMPDSILETDPEIVKEIIECMQCKSVYRILAKEYDFLRNAGVALPRFCFECRHQNRFRQVNFPRLYHRQCMCDYQIYPNSTKHAHHSAGRCPNEFETSYDPGRFRVIYCEACYQSEVI